LQEFVLWLLDEKLGGINPRQLSGEIFPKRNLLMKERKKTALEKREKIQWGERKRSIQWMDSWG